MQIGITAPIEGKSLIDRSLSVRKAAEMGGLKTLAAVAGALIGLSGQAHATTDMAHVLSACAGRLSAQLEHQWLIQDPGSHRTERHRRHVLEIVEALAGPDAAGGPGLAARLYAKAAHADLLRAAAFSLDRSMAEHASRRAEHEMAHCMSLVLPGPNVTSAPEPADRPPAPTEASLGASGIAPTGIPAD